MSGTDLRDLFGQMISAEPAPPFTAAPYLTAGQAAATRRRHRRIAAAGFAVVAVIGGASLAIPAIADQPGRQQTASAQLAAPRVAFVPGVYFQTGDPEVPRGAAWLVSYTVRWHANAQADICAMSGTVFNRDGSKLTGFSDTVAPFPRVMTYRDIVRGSYDEQNPPPYAKVTVTDCKGRSSTASTNIAVARMQETAATFSPGWSTQRCSCWSNGSVRRSAGAGQTAKFTATFNGVAVLTNTGPGRGRADVFIDGRYARTLDTAAATATNRVVGFQTHFDTNVARTVEIRVTSGTVEIDGFLTSHAPVGWGR